jgi:hypothetical protein
MVPLSMCYRLSPEADRPELVCVDTASMRFARYGRR